MRRRFQRRFLVCVIAVAFIAGLAIPQASQRAEASGELPTASQMVQTLKDTHPDKNHPRILAAADDFAQVRQNIAADALAQQIYEQLKEQADSILTAPLPTYSSGLLQTSRDTLNSMLTLGMMIQVGAMEDKAAYVNRAWQILQAAGNFANWNPSHFLDTAEMTMAFAVGYDWIYAEWTEEQRTFIRNAIASKGLQPAKQAYDNGYSADAAWWANVDFNWNSVVNSGITAGALAIADEGSEFEPLAGELLELALEHIQKVLPTFGPDGGGEEGSGYWEYNNKYFVYYAANLLSALGTDYGLTDAPGVSETAYFPIYIAGPGGSFNYGDNYTEVVKDPLFLWYADRFDNADFSNYRLAQLTESTLPEPLDLLWYQPEMANDSYRLDLAKDKSFESVNVRMMRSSWYDPNALFVGLKGGSNLYNHSHLDMGTFVLDALGVRWAQDLGPGTTSLPNYYELVSGRSQYYRERTEGHNTIVLNPGTEDGQYYRASAEIVSEGSSPDQAFMIVDLSEAYATHATEVQRGFALIDHRRQLLVQDEVKMISPGEFYWFMNTRADITIEDGGKSAILSMGDKKLWATILTDEPALSFSVRDPEPLPTSLNPGGQPANSGSKLTIQGAGIDELQLAVLFVPLMEWEEPPVNLPEVKPLAEWQAPDSNAAGLSGIMVNGAPLEGFQQDQYTYYIPWEDPAVDPVISAIPADAEDEVEVVIPEALPGAVTIRVQSDDPQVRDAEYRLVLSLPFNPYKSVLASSHDGNIPENMLDGNLATRWSASGPGQWVQFRSIAPQEIDQVKLAFYSGNARATLFDLLISPDGIDWTTVFSGQSSGTTSDFETFTFDPILAQYIKIIGYGNTVNAWNSISEIEFAGMPEFSVQDVFASASASLDSETLPIGASAPLHITAKMRSGADVDLEQATVNYFSADPSIAQIDSQGIITGIGYGDTEVWAEVTLAGHTKVGIAELTVDDGSITIYPTADAYVRGGDYADNNYGNQQIIELKGDDYPKYTREGYMKFDVSSLHGRVVSAKLLLNASVTEAGKEEATLGVYAANGAWTEGAINWNNKPALAELLGTTAITNQFAWQEVDISEYVQERLMEDGILNLAILQNPEGMDGTGLAANLRSRQHSQKPNLRITLSDTPLTADANNNQISVSADTAFEGEGVTLTAIGDHQSEAGAVIGDRRYIPLSWVSTEAGKSGSFLPSGGSYAATYTPTTSGNYTVTASFALQEWDGTDWVDVPEGTDSKTAALRVTAPGEATAILSVDEHERAPGESIEWTVSVSEATYSFTAYDVIVHFDPVILEFATVQQGDTTMLDEAALESLNEHFAVAGAVRMDDGEIRVIAFTVGNEHAITGSAPLFKLFGKVKNDTAADTSSVVSLSDFIVSYEDTDDLLNTDLATVTLDIIERPIIEDPADVTLLSGMIAQAQGIHDRAPSGDKLGQYPVSAKSTLLAKINAAKSVRDSGTSSQYAVDAAIEALEQALEQFSHEIITLNPGSVRISIRDLSVIAQYYGIDDMDPNWSKVAAADIDDTGVITIETLARVARMILDEWAAGH